MENRRHFFTDQGLQVLNLQAEGVQQTDTSVVAGHITLSLQRV